MTMKPTQNHMTRTFLVACALTLAVSPLWTGCGKKKSTDKAPAKAAAALERPAVGAATPKVDVLAFIDYQCPHSRASAGDLAAFAQKHADVVRIRTLSLPLEVHDASVDLAKAAVAARLQGKWDAYQSAMFANEKPSREAALAWAKGAGLDVAKFEADMGNKAVADEVARDVAIAGALGVTGTPSYIVNGGLLQGARSGEQWDKVVASQVAKYDEIAKKGGKPSEVHAALVLANSKERAPDYARYVLEGQEPPAMPVPAKVARKSGVASAQIMPAGGGTGGIQVGEPVRVGEDTKDSTTVWRVGLRPDDPVRGPAHAQVTMVVFEDFQCPYCAKLQVTLKSLAETYGDKLRVVFKHNPLPFHPDALGAAVAAEAARGQGKFWEMHDALFGDQKALGAEALAATAQKIGLDKNAYDNAVAAAGAKSRVQADMEQAAALSARGTPIVFINGRKMVGARELAEYKAIIEEELPKADALLKQGVALDGLYAKLVGEGKLLDSLASKPVEIDTTGAATRGPSGAAIHIVTFQDLQCPFCARLDTHIAEIEAEFAGRVKVSWMDFPLRDIHPQAELAAQAGKEALAQGKFWPFMAEVMANQAKLDKPGLLEIAAKVGLDKKALDQALESGKHVAAVQRERAEGEKLGVKGTPSVFINGHAFSPQLGFSANTFRSAIGRLLGARQ